MTRSIRAQRGISTSGVLFGLALLGFAVTLIVKLGPHYMEFATVKSSMQRVSENTEVVQRGRRAVLERLSNALYINNVDSVTPQDFTFDRITGGYELGVSYEAREHLFANVDVVLVFAHSVELLNR